MAAVGPADPVPLRFRDIAAPAGVTFRFADGSRGRRDLPEIMGGGVALFDAAGDGRLDLYLANGGPIDPASTVDPPGALYVNRGDGTFAHRSDSPPGPPYAMGCATGDVDGDGRDDLLVTGWRGLRLYRNLGAGRFEDDTERSGLAGAGSLWSTSAAFADLDDDGDLDLFVAAYLDYDPATAPFVAAPDGRRDYAGPEDFAPQPDKLYRNDGGGRFVDVSAAAGVDLPGGRGLGVLAADLVGDRRIDLYVANDGSPAFLFENKGGLRFEEVATASGVALDGRGEAMAGMGVALGEVDGAETLVVTNFLGRGTAAFVARGSNGAYNESADRLGIAGPTRSVNGFGVALADFDGNGRLDLIQANGHVLDRARLGTPFAMRPTLLRLDGRRLVDAGPASDRPILGRGLAIGDLNDDGRPDAVIASLDSPPLVLINESPAPPGLTLDLVARPPAHRSAIGARIRAVVAGRTLSRRIVGGGSYLSASDRRVHLGLGEAGRVDRLEVDWPLGRSEFWSDLPAGRRRIEEGTGRVIGAR